MDATWKLLLDNLQTIRNAVAPAWRHFYYAPAGRAADFDDLVHEVLLKLYPYVAERWDPTRGTKFSGFIYPKAQWLAFDLAHPFRKRTIQSPMMSAPLSYHYEVTTDDGTVMQVDSLHDERDLLAEKQSDMEVESYLEQIRPTLTPQERMVMDLLLCGVDGRQIGTRLNLTESRISQIRSGVKHKLTKVLVRD